MLFTHITYIGIDPTAGKRPMVYAALDNDLRLLALDRGSLDDVLAFVAGQRQAAVAVNAPLCPNQGLMAREKVRQHLFPTPRPGRWMNFRVVEYQLRQHNIRVPQTASREQDCPNWMRTGFTLYHRLDNLGYRPYPTDESKHQYLEVYPHACYAVLLDQNPLPKRTLVGRLQRQLVLHERRLNVHDPMRFFEEITRYRLLKGILPSEILYTSEELDALVAAFTAWLATAHPEQVTRIGDPKESQIVLPVAELKERY